ncbi:MAG: VCBS repeat-containing protein [Bryobacteraceae bacterium]
MVSRSASIGITGVLLILGGLLKDSYADHVVATKSVPPPSPHAISKVDYEDITKSSGLSHFHHEAGEPLKPYLPETTGSGVAVLDYDNDGWLDIYFVNALSHAARRGKAPARPSALFRNNRDGTFHDVTESAGLQNNRWGCGFRGMAISVPN